MALDRRFTLLSPRRLLPLSHDARLLDGGLEGCCAGSTGKLGYDESGEGEMAIGEGLTGNAGSGALNDSL